MLIENEFEIASPVDKVWDYLYDMNNLVPCVPGAELTELNGEQFKGLVTSKVGPVTVKFGGEGEVVSRDATARRIEVDASGAETKGKGTAVVNLVAQLSPSGKGSKVSVRMDLTLSGPIAQFGRGMVADVMAVIMKSFGAAIEENIGRLERGESLVGARATSGLAIGINAAKIALRRVVGRLLGIRSWYES
ncbi:MAG TPA: SRPBCC family protein [Sporichthyaceae bacterium]|jgi:hypothetical protein|nr:SRPBCC family protein [Sporichthyaceae bacterium]